MRDDGLAALEMAEIAASSDSLPRRGEQTLAVLRRVVPFDSAWLALVDPRHPDYTTLADADLAELTRTFLSNRQIARTLVISQRTAAAHVEHILAKPAAPTRTRAAVRAERAGLYVPPCAEERTAAMSGREPELPELRREFAGIAASSATVPERAAEVLRHLERIMAFDAGWVAVRDPERHRHLPLASTGAAAPLYDYFARPEADEELERLGLNGRRPPMLASEIPSPLSEVRAWADHLLPAGFRQGLAAPLFTADGRHVGSLGLLSADPSRPSPADRRVVAAITTVIADDLDRTRDIAETARIIEKASAGVVLTRGGDVLPLPGLPGDRLLVPGSPILTVAADELANSGAYTTFLAPAPGTDGQQLIRVTALDFARPDLDHLSAAVLLCAPGDLHGLTVLDLRVLGLLVEGVTDIPALAQALHLGTAAVADTLGRSLAALRTSDLTAATVRALRSGMRIPPGVTGAA